MSQLGSAALHERVVAALKEVSGESIVPRFNKLRKEDVRAKTHPADLVTIADEEAEQRLTPILRAALRGSRVIGEESVAADAGLLRLLEEDQPVWVIDPVDGTSNFVNGIPRFAVIVALIAHGETIMGWIHDPLTGNTIAAEQGAGAWSTTITGDVSRCELPPAPSALKEMTVALHPKAYARSLGQFARNLRQGSAAHDYWALAEGRMHLLAYRKMKPWDHAAGVLIHREAGGYNAMLDGAPYRPAHPEQEWLLCAPNDALWREIAEMAER